MSASRTARSTSPWPPVAALGRTLHPDNMGAGPASYGMTDTMGRMHSDAQFAGSSSVPAHVDMMGLIGMGNNPMVGATVACAVAVNAAINE
ncbi:MAG: GGGtGRT protein [Collinsella sp.]